MLRQGARREAWYAGPAFHMLAVLMAFYLLSDFSDERGLAIHGLNALVVITFLLGLRALTRQRRVLWLGLGMGTVVLVSLALAERLYDGFDYRWNTIAVLVFFLLVLGTMAKVVFQTEIVTTDKIFAAACVYMLMGICFGLVFMLIEQSYPGSFALSAADTADLAGALVHFSFTTLTTVGYGDIAPRTSTARSLADLEAVIAQLFLAVVLARLVSLQITRTNRAS
jgi:hypothetical protein